MGDLFDWALSSLKENNVARLDTLPWNAEVERSLPAAKKLDDYSPPRNPSRFLQKLFPRGLADSLTHVGQIAMLRRLGGSTHPRGKLFQADIAVGRVGPDQPSPRREFE